MNFHNEILETSKKYLQTVFSDWRLPITDYLTETYGGFGVIFVSEKYVFVFNHNFELLYMGNVKESSMIERVKYYAAIIANIESRAMFLPKLPYVVLESKLLGLVAFNTAKFEYLKCSAPVTFLSTPSSSFNLLPFLILNDCVFDVMLTNSKTVKFERAIVELVIEEEVELPVYFTTLMDSCGHPYSFEIPFIGVDAKKEHSYHHVHKTTHGLLILQQREDIVPAVLSYELPFLNYKTIYQGTDERIEKLQKIAFIV